MLSLALVTRKILGTQVWLNYTMLPSKVTTFRMQPFFAQGGILESASVAQVDSAIC